MENRRTIRIADCLKMGLCILLLALISGCGRRGDPVLIPSYDEKTIEQDSGKNKEGETIPGAETAGKEETVAAIPDAPSELVAVYTGKSVVLAWKEVLKQGFCIALVGLLIPLAKTCSVLIRSLINRSWIRWLA